MIETPVTGGASTGDPTPSRAGGPPRFFVLFVSPTGAILAGTCGRGISRSVDGGDTWQPVDDTFGGADVNGLAAAPDGALLAATGAAGVLRSTDDGLTWDALGPGGVTAYAVAAAPQLMVGTDNGVSVRAEGAPTWTTMADGPASAVYRVLPLADGRVAVATDGDGVWILDRDGNWVATGLADAPVFALVDLGEGRILAGTRGDGIHRSDDAGASWTRLDGELPDPVVHVLTSAADGCVLAGTGRGVVRSDDGGTSWTPVGVELAHHRIFSLTATPHGTVLAGSYDGVWTCELSTGRWRPVDTGLTVGEAYAVVADTDGLALAGAKGGAFQSSDDGATWRPSSGLEGVNSYCFCFVSTGEVFAGTDDGLRARRPSRDGWERAGLDGQRVFCLLETGPGSLLAGTLGGGVLRRDERDEPWQRADHGLPHPMVFDLLRSRVSGDVLAAAGNVVDGTKTGGIYRSTDGGRAWTPTGHEPITVYAIAETSDGTMVAGAQRSCILRSTDGGATWTATRPAGLDDSKMFCLAIDDSDRLYLGSGAQLLRSDDAALSWHVVGDGLDGVTVYDLCPHPSGALLAATSSGIYRSHDDGRSWSPAPWPD